MVKYNFKDIHVVPTAEKFIDIMLSKTNRQTPTIVRSGWKISRIRQFYMRKVRFTQQSILDRLTKILDQFPKLDSIHPFYADLINVLYDRDHFKIALSQVNIARQIVTNIGKDYIKLLKYGDSLYRCKQLKRAALGRMVKILKQQAAALAYLEQVRQHLSRLPTIDPHTRTMLLTGFPNVGKSSFMKHITHADVEVQSYAFTTKSLYVGHFDYNYLRWQAIDSPGVLDRPLEERNSIEMQAITALAHLNCVVIFFIDLSPHCEYSIQNQCKLYSSLAPLFNNKPVLLVLNKTDLRHPNDLDQSEKEAIEKLKKYKNITIMSASNTTKTNVMECRNAACDLLLSQRLEVKAMNNANNFKNIQNRVDIAVPQKRDNKERPLCIPPKTSGMAGSASNGQKRKLLKEVEQEMGGPGVFNFDTREHWNLSNSEWKYDTIPEIYNGKNVSDFYSNDVFEKLEELEREEANIQLQEDARMQEKDQIAVERLKRRMARKNASNNNLDSIEIDMDENKKDTDMVGNNINNDNDDVDSGSDLDSDHELMYAYINRKMVLSRREQGHKKSILNTRPRIARSDQKIEMSDVKEKLEDLGINTNKMRQFVSNENKKESNNAIVRGRTQVRSISMTPMMNNRNNRDRNVDRNDNNKNESDLNKFEPKSGLEIQDYARASSMSRARGRSKERKLNSDGTIRMTSRKFGSKSREITIAKGLASVIATKKAMRLKMRAIKVLQRSGANHESDRRITDTKPKHLNVGKGRGFKGDWR